MENAEVAAYIGRWRPSTVSAPAAAFARDVITAVGPEGKERAKNLLWAAGKLADYAIGLGLEPVPEVVLHPSVAERFTRCAPGLSGVARRTLRTNLRFIGRRVVPHLYPADLPLPRERAKQPYSPAQIDGFLALADAQPTTGRRMRAAGLVCLGAGAGLIRGDLRDVRGSDVACRSGGVVVTVRGARPRAVPVLARYHARLLAAARFAGNALVCGGADPGRRNITNPLITALDGGTGLPRLDTVPAAGDLAGRGRGAARAGHVHARGRDQLLPAARRPGRRARARPTRPRRCGCSGAPGGDDPAGGIRGDHRRLRRRAADRGHAARRGAAPAAERPHPAGRDVPDPGRPQARAPDPGARRADRPARARAAAARRDRRLEGRPAPADLPADRADLRPGRRRPRQGPARRAALRPAAAPLRRPARGIHPGAVQGRQHVAGGGLDGPGILLPAPAARHQRLRRPRGVLGPPQEQPAAQPRRAVLRLLPLRRDHDARGKRAGRPRARPPRHAVVVPARPGPRLRSRADRDARPGDPARRHPRRLRLRPPRRRSLGHPAQSRRRPARPGPAPARPRAQGHPRRRGHQPTATCTAPRHRARCWNSGRSPAPPPGNKPRTGNARPPSWPGTSSAASPATTKTATTACSAPPPWARSAARSAPRR